MLQKKFYNNILVPYVALTMTGWIYPEGDSNINEKKTQLFPVLKKYLESRTNSNLSFMTAFGKHFKPCL